MSDTHIIDLPGGFVPLQAVSFGDVGAPATPVTPADPLPVATTLAAATSTALTGTASASGIVGPFVPELGRAIWLRLSGSWSGTVQLLRSTDGGATKAPLTLGGSPWAIYTANAQEAVAEETVAGGTCYLQITLSSGSVSYEVTQ